MSPRLRKEDLVTLQVLSERGQSNRSAAARLGVTEGAVRYRLRTAGRPDGRAGKPHRAEAQAAAIDGWVRQQSGGDLLEGADRPVNVRALFDWLAAEYGYAGSYQSVLRFVRARYGRPKLRPYRRVETPPGAQAQVAGGEFPGVDVGSGPETLDAFVMPLSHSRHAAVVWSRRVDQLAWQHAHNEALRRLGGVPAVLRIDNLKTGVGERGGAVGRGQRRRPGLRASGRLPRRRLLTALPRRQGHRGERRRLCAAAAGPDRAVLRRVIPLTIVDR
jgi:transposase